MGACVRVDGVRPSLGSKGKREDARILIFREGFFMFCVALVCKIAGIFLAGSTYTDIHNIFIVVVF